MSNYLNKTYDPKDVEDKIYAFWENREYFKARVDKTKKPYTVMMPPPNITGNLHIGHALDDTMQDILVRLKRMQGFMALYLPGTDHASIATEAKIVEEMRAEGVSKEDLGREGFLKRAWEWKEKYGSTIVNQIKKLGASCDWSKERFTMDEGCSLAVREYFVRLYERGLVYRGERIINWCPKCMTSIADLEVNFEEKDGSFWHINYPLADDIGYVQVATTRPETMFGDVALAVHPEDSRHKHLIGKTVIIPVVDRKIPIIADEYVDMELGTGVLKITPAHDSNDFEVGQRHNLPVINVMNENATMNENAGKYKNLDRYQARKLFVKDLQGDGCISEIKEIRHNIGLCYRCSCVVEPQISTQWFVKMKPLAERAIQCVKQSKTKFVPARFSKIYYHWMENIKDWCVSRQLWWGHRIPAWYCDECGEITVSREDVAKCSKCSSENLRQDEDTFDTWFSSALWPFSTLGWPESTEELKYFYPTNTLVTGRDLIFFWVSKMIFSALELTGEVPFEHVVIHGLALDSKGRKMSKSLGNGVDPLEMIEKYGADALRFSFIVGNSPGNDFRFSIQKVESSRNFANKIWNAARFIHMNTDGCNVKNEIPQELSLMDKWILSRLNKVVKNVNEDIEKFEFGQAAQKLYDFIWDEFCDWYVEFSKISTSKEVLIWVMSKILALLHPFMPFVTEEIWQTFPQKEESLMVSEYPKYRPELNFPEYERNIQILMEIIKSIRNRRSEMNVQPGKKTMIYIEPSEFQEMLNSHKDIICKLAYAADVRFSNNFGSEKMAVIVTNHAKIHIPINELIDKESEILRLTKELDEAGLHLKQAQVKLNNQQFITKAPKDIVDKIKETETKLKNKIKGLQKSISEM